MSTASISIGRIGRAIAHRSPLRFVQRVRATQRLGWKPGDPEQSGIAGELQRNGVVVLPGVLDEETVASLRSDSRPVLDAALAGEEQPFRSVSDGRNTAFVERADQFSEALVAALEDVGIAQYASAAAGVALHPTTFRAELKTASEQEYPYVNPDVDVWHVDHWDVRTKAMVYVEDVSAENAPLRYLAGSHHKLAFSPAWLPVNWVREFFMSVPRVPSFVAGVWSRYASRRTDVRYCVGPAGTIVLFDTRGLHSGTALRTGERHIFNVHFSPR